MRGEKRIKVEELNRRLKRLTGSPDDVDLRKMSLADVQDLISRSRPRMVEIAIETRVDNTVHTKDNGSSYHIGRILSDLILKVLSLFRIFFKNV